MKKMRILAIRIAIANWYSSAVVIAKKDRLQQKCLRDRSSPDRVFFSVLASMVWSPKLKAVQRVWAGRCQEENTEGIWSYYDKQLESTAGEPQAQRSSLEEMGERGRHVKVCLYSVLHWHEISIVNKATTPQATNPNRWRTREENK